MSVVVGLLKKKKRESQRLVQSEDVSEQQMVEVDESFVAPPPASVPSAAAAHDDGQVVDEGASLVQPEHRAATPESDHESEVSVADPDDQDDDEDEDDNEQEEDENEKEKEKEKDDEEEEEDSDAKLDDGNDSDEKEIPPWSRVQAESSYRPLVSPRSAAAAVVIQTQRSKGVMVVENLPSPSGAAYGAHRSSQVDLEADFALASRLDRHKSMQEMQDRLAAEKLQRSLEEQAKQDALLAESERIKKEQEDALLAQKLQEEEAAQLQRVHSHVDEDARLARQLSDSELNSARRQEEEDAKYAKKMAEEMARRGKKRADQDEISMEEMDRRLAAKLMAQEREAAGLAPAGPPAGPPPDHIARRYKPHYDPSDVGGQGLAADEAALVEGPYMVVHEKLIELHEREMWYKNDPKVRKVKTAMNEVTETFFKQKMMMIAQLPVEEQRPYHDAYAGKAPWPSEVPVCAFREIGGQDIRPAPAAVKVEVPAELAPEDEELDDKAKKKLEKERQKRLKQQAKEQEEHEKRLKKIAKEQEKLRIKMEKEAAKQKKKEEEARKKEEEAKAKALKAAQKKAGAPAAAAAPAAAPAAVVAPAGGGGGGGGGVQIGEANPPSEVPRNHPVGAGGGARGGARDRGEAGGMPAVGEDMDPALVAAMQRVMIGVGGEDDEGDEDRNYAIALQLQEAENRAAAGARHNRG